LAERTEIEAYTDHVLAAPQPVRDLLGIAAARIGPVQALLIGNDPSTFFNRASGFGIDEPVTVDLVADVCDFFRAHAVPQGTLMIAPPLLPPDWAQIAANQNIVQGGRFVKLVGDLASMSTMDSAAALAPGLRVGRVDRDQALDFATVMMTTFGFTAPGMIEMAAAGVGRPRWEQYAVWEGDRIVAIGSVFLNGECADMFGGATLPDARRRGAQSALLSIRTSAARAAGCRWIVAETGADGPGGRNVSLHNMLRTGFEPLYERVSWNWQAPN
jgi:GNAT superfamily N-acetyltransferase